jgi:hypothetical protein
MPVVTNCVLCKEEVKDAMLCPRCDALFLGAGVLVFSLLAFCAIAPFIR